MIDRAITEAVTYRVAVAALTYYPDKENDQPGYNLTEDVDWCLEPLDGELTTDSRASLSWLVSHTITDPTTNRERFTSILASISE